MTISVPRTISHPLFCGECNGCQFAAKVNGLLEHLDESYLLATARLDPGDPNYYAELDGIMIKRAAARARVVDQDAAKMVCRTRFSLIAEETK